MTEQLEWQIQLGVSLLSEYHHDEEVLSRTAGIIERVMLHRPAALVELLRSAGAEGALSAAIGRSRGLQQAIANLGSSVLDEVLDDSPTGLPTDSDSLVSGIVSQMHRMSSLPIETHKGFIRRVVDLSSRAENASTAAAWICQLDGLLNGVPAVALPDQDAAALDDEIQKLANDVHSLGNEALQVLARVSADLVVLRSGKGPGSRNLISALVGHSSPDVYVLACDEAARVAEHFGSYPWPFTHVAVNLLSSSDPRVVEAAGGLLRVVASRRGKTQAFNPEEVRVVASRLGMPTSQKVVSSVVQALYGHSYAQRIIEEEISEQGALSAEVIGNLLGLGADLDVVLLQSRLDYGSVQTLRSALNQLARSVDPVALSEAVGVLLDNSALEVVTRLRIVSAAKGSVVNVPSAKMFAAAMTVAETAPERQLRIDAAALAIDLVADDAGSRARLQAWVRLYGKDVKGSRQKDKVATIRRALRRRQGE